VRDSGVDVFVEESRTLPSKSTANEVFESNAAKGMATTYDVGISPLGSLAFVSKNVDTAPPVAMLITEKLVTEMTFEPPTAMDTGIPNASTSLPATGFGNSSPI